MDIFRKKTTEVKKGSSHQIISVVECKSTWYGNSEHLVKVVSVGFLHCQVTTFPFPYFCSLEASPQISLWKVGGGQDSVLPAGKGNFFI